MSFYYSLLKRPELEEVFVRYTKDNSDGRMNAKDLMRFQLKEQKREMIEEECQKIIEAFEPMAGFKTLSMEGEESFTMKFFKSLNKTLFEQGLLNLLVVFSIIFRLHPFHDVFRVPRDQ